MSFDNSTHLQNVLDTHKMSHVQAFVDKVKKKRTEIVDNINSKYSTSQRYNAFNSGSMAKHTATNIKFDMDVVIPFKHSAFATLEEMFDALYDFLNEMYGQWKNRGGVTPEAEGRLTTENFLILTPKVSWPTGSFLFQRITSWSVNTH